MKHRFVAAAFLHESNRITGTALEHGEHCTQYRRALPSPHSHTLPNVARWVLQRTRRQLASNARGTRDQPNMQRGRILLGLGAAAWALCAVDTVAARPTSTSCACPPPSRGSSAVPTGHGDGVYLGNGCFWHTQYDLYTVELAPPFNRNTSTATARTGYGGSVGNSSAQHMVCYMTGPDWSTPCPPGTYYGYPGGLAYAEAAQVCAAAAPSMPFNATLFPCHGENFVLLPGAVRLRVGWRSQPERACPTAAPLAPFRGRSFWATHADGADAATRSFSTRTPSWPPRSSPPWPSSTCAVHANPPLACTALAAGRKWLKWRRRKPR